MYENKIKNIVFIWEFIKEIGFKIMVFDFKFNIKF